ncbi:MAG: ShlB/FhaC/HecB family hemolysin secretion/activation protein, partial [Alphaproteobacteria bacterium]|nr:ShlB/FhaC/HecB family hemolysin secretion/activation protein [Alphaproteobacteria bacterium]
GSGTEIERRVPTRTAPRPADRAVPAPPVAPAEPAALTPFTLAGVVVDGATAIDPVRFVPLYESMIATTVTADDLARLTRAIGDAYRDAGYALATAYIPAQAITAGVVHVRVVEGHVESIAFGGGPGDAAIVRHTLRAVTAERPLTLATLERRLLLLNDIPGVRVADARMRAVDVERGAYELILDLRAVPFDALATLDNRGTRSNGPWQLWAGGGANLLLGDGAWRVHAGALTNPASPREIRYGTAGVQRTLGSNGTMLRAMVGASDNVAGKPLSDSGVETASLRFIAGASHPLLRSRTRSLWVTGSFDVQRATENRFGADWSRDDLRVLRASTYLFQADPWGGENGLNLEGSLGLDILGASSAGIDRSRSDASGRFAKLRADAVRTQRLFGPFSAQLQLSGQIANRSLLSAEEFSLGGARYGRAFEPSELAGDRGWAGSAELRWSNPVRFDERVETELFAFADTGVVWNDQLGKDPREHLSSAGAGVRLRFQSWIRVAAEVATPLDSSSRDLRRQGPRAFLSVAFEY